MDIHINISLPKHYPVTRQKLRRIFKWMHKHQIAVNIAYEYNNSLGHHEFRECSGQIEHFDIRTEYYVDEKTPDCYKVTATLNKDGRKNYLEEYIPADAYFVGMGRIEWCHSGPYCYFTVTKNEIEPQRS